MPRYEELIRPVWAEIDLGAIGHNVREIRQIIGPKPKIMAVVKADAYGHGAVTVARAALAAGAEWLGVSLPEEGIALRQAGLAAPILVLGPLQPGQVEPFLAHQLTPTICQREAAQALSEAAAARGRRSKSISKWTRAWAGSGSPRSRPLLLPPGCRLCPVSASAGFFPIWPRADERDKTHADGATPSPFNGSAAP